MFDSVKKEKNKRASRRIYNESAQKILSDDSEFIVNEAYKAARTNIMFSLHDEDGCKSIICTSAMPGEGKTTTCVNMAISFAQTGAKVILIDADLRKPKVGRYLEIEEHEGLSDYLGKFVKDVDSIINKVEGRNIDCITAGYIPPNPAELLGSEEMNTLLEKLGETYDYIFMDAPPVNVVTDAIVLSEKCTGVMLVVKENDTTHDMLNGAITSLKFANARIVGIIVNGSVVKKSGKYKYRKRKYGVYGQTYSYGYSYGYGYDYGYSYGEDSVRKRKIKIEESDNKKTELEKTDVGETEIDNKSKAGA